ncbi:hypothetical protein C0J52_15818 [Blattella germanica]|nr:hypothetical protein C0J52_15818 [Blattella germanica]
MECGSSFTQVHLRMEQNATRSWKLDLKRLGNILKRIWPKWLLIRCVNHLLEVHVNQLGRLVGNCRFLVQQFTRFYANVSICVPTNFSSFIN